MSHATPACAYANNVSRDDYQDIARDQLGLPSIAHHTTPLPGLDVLVGGGFGVDVRDDKGQGANFEPGNKYVAESTLREIDAVGGGRYRLALRTPGRPGADVLSEANSAVAIEPLWEAARSRTETLTSYAVLFRYPGESATRALAKTALKDAQWVRSMVRSSMRLRGR